MSEGLNTLQTSIDNGIISIEKNGELLAAHFEILAGMEGYTFSLCSFAPIIYRDIQLHCLAAFVEMVKEYLE